MTRKAPLPPPVDGSYPPDFLFSQHRILPLPNGVERVPQEAAYRFQSWCDFLGVDPNSLAEPWIPIGNIGPVLLLAHHNPSSTETVLPKWFCGLFLVSRENYLALQKDLQGMQADTVNLNLKYDQPPRSWPSDAPQLKDDHECCQFILNHVILDDSLREATSAALRNGITAAEMPPGLREAVMLLRHQCFVTEMRFIRPPQNLTDLAPNTFGRYNCIAFYRSDKSVWLASSFAPDDPLRRECIDNFNSEARLKTRVHMVMAPRDQIANLILRCKSGGMESASLKAVTHYARKADLTLDSHILQNIDPYKIDTSEQKIVEWLIGQTILKGSQDLHVDYANGEGRFRINVDGKLREILRVTEVRYRICNSLIRDQARCTKSEFDCESKHFTCRLDSELVDFRVEATTFRDGSMPPTLTLRLLGRQSTGRLLSDLRLREDYVSKIREFIRFPYGLMLVTGPTGSGKSTSLYAALNELNAPNKKILTAEDPVEQIIEGVLQSQVDEGKGITYEKLLRSFLRCAPNVIMIGEIRDKETAKIAVEAAGTGHLVLASLHTNTIAGAVTRLHDAFGINRSVLSDVFIGGLSQRLLRMLCPECKQSAQLLPEETAVFERVGLTPPPRCFRRRETGCQHCEGDGTIGRVAVMELMYNNRKLREGIRDDKTAEQLAEISQATGNSSMLCEGLGRFAEGLVDFSEIHLFDMLDR